MAKPVSFNDLTSKKFPICVIGLGYVGLPLAVAFASRFDVIGLDVNAKRVKELEEGYDRTRELTASQLQKQKIRFTTNHAAISEAYFIIVTVPTPIDEHRRPDLTPLAKASEMIGRQIKPGTIVVYESTVYPGCTEEDCIPLIEKLSGFKWKDDFFVGYSPERINPGDKEHTIDKIKKVVSGDTAETTALIEKVYGEIITAGVHVAATIKTAEAAKVIENTQRDLNIALMNELALIFDRQGINTLAVLEAAGTKWNFMPFRPGLVGGHCIGVDPYYLTYKAESLGYHPEVILAGRRINDAMGKVVAEKTVKCLISTERSVKGARVLILGWTFKENVPDTRNTRIIDIHQELATYGIHSLPFDPHADSDEVEHECGVRLIQNVDEHRPYDAVILAVKHRELITEYPLERLYKFGNGKPPAIIDVKGFFSAEEYEAAGVEYWQL
jgi:UDP-N-acetyl-D-galactosamine dehydrogenase